MDVWLLAAQLVFNGSAPLPEEAGWAVQPSVLPSQTPKTGRAAGSGDAADPRLKGNQRMAVVAPASPSAPSMGAALNGWPSPEQVMLPSRRPSLPPGTAYLKPITGSQLYQFRVAALDAGELYAQARPDRYIGQWQQAFSSPTHGDWQGLLAAEAATTARHQEESLSVIVGDSLALWLPVDELPPNQLWLNQSISGETTAHILQRLHYFADTRPQTIHVMAGINDLKNGVPEAEVVDNLYQIMVRLQQQHPQAQLVMYSILPTRIRELPSDRIQRVNQRLATLATHQGATFVDLHPTFSDSHGLLRPDLTTDGLHLSPQGYSLWEAALASH